MLLNTSDRIGRITNATIVPEYQLASTPCDGCKRGTGSLFPSVVATQRLALTDGTHQSG